MKAPDIRNERNDIHGHAVVEGFIEGREFALEGLMTAGRLRTLALFDKPDPLDGPFFEETIYVTPSSQSQSIRRAIADEVALRPMRWAPARSDPRRVPRQPSWRLRARVAARPIGGLCAGRCGSSTGEWGREAVERTRDLGDSGSDLVRGALAAHAVGRSVAAFEREPLASGVMMIPIPRRGVFRDVSGLDGARSSRRSSIFASLPGPSRRCSRFRRRQLSRFIFRAPKRRHGRERAPPAHGCLRFDIDPEVRMLQSVHG